MLEKKDKLRREEQEIIARFERTTRNAANVQQETLLRILHENAGVEYLRKLGGLAGCTDVDSFRACVPVVTHADLEPYIQRIADGDTSPILTAKPVGLVRSRLLYAVARLAVPQAANPSWGRSIVAVEIAGGPPRSGREFLRRCLSMDWEEEWKKDGF